MPNPPTPRRYDRMLEAHRLDCQGLSLQQIGDPFGYAPRPENHPLFRHIFGPPTPR